MNRRIALVLIALVLVLTGPAGAKESEEGRLTAAEISAEVRGAMDRSADPCQDFYRYACGGWLDNTELPSDQSRWVRSFSVIRENNRELVRGILEDAAKSPGSDPDRRRIGSYYGSCMDEKAIGKAGAKPLEPIFAEIDAVKDARSLLEVTGRLHRRDVDALFGLGVVPDFKDPDRNIAFFAQGGLGLPDRDYYVSEEETKRELLRAYERHVARVFHLLGEDEATAARRAGAVLVFETELAQVSRPRQEMRQVDKLYNKIDRGGLQERTPSLPWGVYFATIGYPDVVDINVATPEFFDRLDALVGETDPETLRTYLRWQTAHEFAEVLSDDFVTADFEYYGNTLRGQKELEPRWKRCVDATQAALGEVIGKVYVQLRFGGSSKDKALEMISDIQTAFENSLPALNWMDDATRARALEKKSALRNKIGYPDNWRDYSAMQIKKNDFFGNVLAALEFEFDRQARKIGNPVDPKEWLMTPQMVNAYYHPLLNEMAFPAGILQPPFFHRDFPAVMNYGGIGGVIGHELTHGFDDQGRKFDPSGQMREWWEPQATEKFQAQAQCVDDFYSAYEVEPGVHVNGQLTLGENIADIGGVKEAYFAYGMWQDRHGAPKAAIEGLSNEQLFFVSWGQVWCSIASPESDRLQVTTDPHSPARFRVMGPLTHNEAFAAAFACDAETPMVAENRCEVW